MIVLQIDITNIEDIMSTNNAIAINSIFSVATEVLRGGGRVVLKRSYCNAPDDIIRFYTTEGTFASDWQNIFEQAKRA